MPWRKTVVNIQSFSAAVIEAVPVDGDAAPCQLRLILAADSKDGPAVVLRGKYSSLHGIATALTNQFGLPVKDHAAHKQPSTRFSWKLPTLFAWKWDAAFRSKPQASPQASPKNPPRQSTVK
jgi:hypothetical protein